MNTSNGSNTTRPATFLVVEDDTVDMMAVKRGLSKQNLASSIVEARDGIEALEILRSSPKTIKRPFVILLDLNMPRMNGHEFLAELRNDPELADSVVFVLTTSDAESDRRAAYSHQVAGYITKDGAGSDFARLSDLLRAFWDIVVLPA